MMIVCVDVDDEAADDVERRRRKKTDSVHVWTCIDRLSHRGWDKCRALGCFENTEVKVVMRVDDDG